MSSFQIIYDRAVGRKGGETALQQRLLTPKSPAELEDISSDRYLAMMTRCINRAGFNWTVIDNKWPDFEQAFFGFRIDTLLMLSDEQWEAYLQDKRVVRHWQKIKTVRDNARFIASLEQESYAHSLEHSKAESISGLIAQWPASDQTGLHAFLKKHGSRLGGQTGRYFLREMGKDGYSLSRDVISALISSGLDIRPQASSQRDLNLIQQTFNQWHEEHGLPYTHLSMIAGFSCGDNLDHF